MLKSNNNSFQNLTDNNKSNCVQDEDVLDLHAPSVGPNVEYVAGVWYIEDLSRQSGESANGKWG